MSKHRILTHYDRYTIEKLLLAKEKVSSIAKTLGFHRSTIYRELSRNKDYYGNYNSHIAEKKSIKALSKRGRNAFLDKDFELSSLVSDLLTINKFSPEEVSAELRKTKYKHLSFMSIYRYIYKDRKNGGKIYENSRVSKHRKVYEKGIYNTLKGKKHISERPEIVNKKYRSGDWELDIVEVLRGSEYLITMVERKSKFVIIQKTNTKNADIVADLIIDALKPIKDQVFTITTDNGVEFSKFRRIEEALDANIYFTDPYSSWQKGLIEKINKDIRYFVPKRGKYKATHVSYKELEKMEYLINNRPRKKLKYKTPNEVFMKVDNFCIIDYASFKKVSRYLC